jgi:hypothetical protein
MAMWSVFGAGQTSNNTLLSAGLACGATLRRGRVFDIVLGSAASPNDGTFNVNLIRTSTGAGTSTAVTPTALDPGDATAATATAGTTFTVNPTLGVIALNLGFNQRSTMRWFAAPGEELVYAATQYAGLGVQPASPSPTASNIAHTIAFREE